MIVQPSSERLEQWVDVDVGNGIQSSLHIGKVRNKTSGRKSACFLVWYHLDSNQGHMDFQSIALPTELHHLPGGKYTSTIEL